METRKIETLSIWDGSLDITWHNEKGNKFHIKTAAQLAGLAYLVNLGYKFKNETVYLDTDIDLNNNEWVPIGTETFRFLSILRRKRFFSGTFDGQYHFIKNLTTNSSNYCHGLFGYVRGGTIKKIRLVDACIKNDENFDDSNKYVGILVDRAEYSSILNSYTTGKIINGSKTILSLGGVVGFCQYDSKIIGCYSTAKINSNCSYEDKYARAGGICGGIEDTFISDCWFGGSINCNNDDLFIGGIIGIISNNKKTQIRINNCFIVLKYNKIIKKKSCKESFIANIDIHSDYSEENDLIENIKKDKYVAKNCYLLTENYYYIIFDEYDNEYDSEENNKIIKCFSIGLINTCRDAILDPIIKKDVRYAEDRKIPMLLDRDTNIDKGMSWANILKQCSSYKGAKWVIGIDHPTFYFDDPENIPIDRYV